jgi:ATP diphosphatase
VQGEPHRPLPAGVALMAAIDRLLTIMARLRDPRAGCPWDLDQDFASIAPHTIEEAYEVDDAIQRGDLAGLRDELGDLLFQVVFHAQLAREEGAFDFEEVAESIADKMESRHPHVFGAAKIADAAAQTRAWEVHKLREAELAGRPRESALDGVTLGLPALLRAQKLGRRAARAGYDWARVTDVMEKLHEELAELEAEVAVARSGGTSTARVAEELGDVLFVCTGVAERFGLEAEQVLRGANRKFEERFRAMEAMLAEEGRPAASLDAEAWLALWQRVKRAGRAEAS